MERLFGARERQHVVAVLDGGDLEGGAVVTELEGGVAALCEVGLGVATSSATAALFLALAAAGIGAGDEVLVADLGGPAALNAVSLAGATAVLVDVEARTGGMDPARAAAAITPRARAMVVAHVGGRAADVAALRSLAHRFGVALIEDLAGALGSRAGGIPLGAHGHAGCVSFGADALVTTGRGGLVVTRDARAERRMRELAARHELAMPALSAAVGLAQLETLPERIAHRRWLRERYRAALDGVARVALAPLDDSEVPGGIEARVDGGRDALVAALAAAGYAARPRGAPLHAGRDEDRRFPVAARLAAESLWLPAAPELGDADVARIADAVRRWSRT